MVKTPAGIAAFRDLTVADVESLVRYWFESGDEHLDFLGIDRELLGSRGDTRQRFMLSVPTGDPDQRTISFAITLDGDLAGYTLLNRYTLESNYSHWHLIKPDIRRAGISTALYPYRIKLYFERYALTRLIHQTRTRNIGVNRMLDKFVPIAETIRIEKPDGVALPGEFNLRYVTRSDIPRLFEVAKQLEPSRGGHRER